MKNISKLLLITGILLTSSLTLNAKTTKNTKSIKNVKVENPKVNLGGEFSTRVLIDNLEGPWEMIWGPDNKLWITERQGKHISTVDPKTGEHKILYTFENAFAAPPHEGVLGMALDGNFVYVAYIYKTDGDTKEFARIVRLEYNKKLNKLENETIVIDKLPGSNDHNSGRLLLGKDGKLYYTIGDQGANQGKSQFVENLAQVLPTAQDVKNKDYSKYPGSILRLNTDGSIPDDNPTIKGVKSHIYTYGHRNAQGLIFVGDKLFSVEHGPSSDDELNLIVAGGNYGWPRVAGFRDNLSYKYTNYSLLANDKDRDNKIKDQKIIDSISSKETDFYDENYKDPLKTFFTVNDDYDYKKAGAFIYWPTMAPSSVAYYPADGKIIEWRNSLLISTLKNGALYRVPLNSDQTNVQGDLYKHFKSNNRYRKVLVSPDTTKIFIATDNVGMGIGLDGQPNREMANKGAIIIFEYK